MDAKRVFALAAMILVASYANTYVAKPTEAACEIIKTTAATNPDEAPGSIK